MRLIDADELIDWICNDSGDKMMDEYYIEHINNMPTAYDVEKVVEKLERISIEEPLTTDGVKTGTIKVLILKHAVEIVKDGFRTDNVCE